MAKESAVLKKKLPAVLSLTRCINVRDALFYNKLENGDLTRLDVIRGGMRGTKNINGSKRADEDVNNVQVTDTAKSSQDAVAVVVKTSITFTNIANGVSSCASSKGDDRQILVDFKDEYNGFIQRAIEDKTAMLEIGCRYARNIANARWLWRNLQYALSVKVNVKAGDDLFSFESLDVPVHHFNDYSEQEIALGTIIAQSLSGLRRTVFEVTAEIDFGGEMNKSCEVFPSQNYLSEKPKGFSRSLYAVGHRDMDLAQSVDEFNATPSIGQAAIRDTKLANALRTFDTWYSDFDKVKTPIAIEPCGANLGTQMMHRKGTETSFAMFKRFNDIQPNTGEGLFLIGCIIRGGVYSEGGDK